LLHKLRAARNLRAVVASTPTSVKSFILKYLEICHILDQQNNLAAEKIETVKLRSRFAAWFGRGPKLDYLQQISPEELESLKEQSIIARQIFDILRGGIEIMDEVDLILHPLKSELNWPLGKKSPLDFTLSAAGTGLRWAIPAHLFDAIFSCSGKPILAEMADSKEAG
jgi:hypothetical protein